MRYKRPKIAVLTASPVQRHEPPLGTDSALGTDPAPSHGHKKTATRVTVIWVPPNGTITVRLSAKPKPSLWMKC